MFVQSKTGSSANPIIGGEITDIANLLLMLAVMVGMLLTLNQPVFTYGLTAMAVGGVAGFLKYQSDSGTIKIARKKLGNSPEKELEAAAKPEIPGIVALTIPKNKLAAIDTLLPGKNPSAERRGWIMTAIDEKLGHENTPKPKFPTAA